MREKKAQGAIEYLLALGAVIVVVAVVLVVMGTSTEKSTNIVHGGMNMLTHEVKLDTESDGGGTALFEDGENCAADVECKSNECDVGGTNTCINTLPPDAIEPASISSTPLTDSITLSWTNPTNNDFEGTLIKRNVDAAGDGCVGDYPASTGEGTLVFEGKETSVTDSGLSSGTTYCYSFFSYDNAANYSTPTNYSTTTVSLTCPNGVIDAGEECDPGPPEQLGGKTCESLQKGYWDILGGSLSCNANCTFDESGCIDNTSAYTPMCEGWYCTGYTEPSAVPGDAIITVSWGDAIWDEIADPDEKAIQANETISYRIYYSETDYGNCGDLASANQKDVGSVLTADLTAADGIVNGTTYYIYITALDEHGNESVDCWVYPGNVLVATPSAPAADCTNGICDGTETCDPGVDVGNCTLDPCYQENQCVDGSCTSINPIPEGGTQPGICDATNGCNYSKWGPCSCKTCFGSYGCYGESEMCGVEP